MFYLRCITYTKYALVFELNLIFSILFFFLGKKGVAVCHFLL